MDENRREQKPSRFPGVGEAYLAMGEEARARAEAALEKKEAEQQAEKEPVRKIGIGAVLESSAGVFAKNPLPYLVFALLAGTPKIVMPLLWGSSRTVEILASILAFVLQILFLGAITHSVYQDLTGKRGRIAESAMRGLSRFFSLLGTVLLFGLLLLLMLLPMIILPSIAVFLVIILFAYAYCCLVVAVPACVVERLGPMASLDRSAVLTKGNRWSVFGLLFLLWLAAAAVGYLVAMILPDASRSETVVGTVVRTVFEAFKDIVAAALYYHLRSAREGVDIDKLVTVFD